MGNLEVLLPRAGGRRRGGGLALAAEGTGCLSPEGCVFDDENVLDETRIAPGRAPPPTGGGITGGGGLCPGKRPRFWYDPPIAEGSTIMPFIFKLFSQSKTFAKVATITNSLPCPVCFSRVVAALVSQMPPSALLPPPLATLPSQAPSF